MRAVFIVSVLVAGTICAGQAPPKKSVPKTTAEHSTLVCPDAEAQQACRSYQELLKAKDTGLPADKAYICFRKKVDEFFVVSFFTPYFRKHWDQELKQMVADQSQRPGYGLAQTYKDGVLSLSVTPALVFSGQWQPIPYSESGIFVSDRINTMKQDQNDANVGVSIDESQVSIGYKYKNKNDKTTQYTLTIQRSTGRFTESFLEEAEKVPFLEGTGYCAYH
jgi:hypothetical protein